MPHKNTWNEIPEYVFRGTTLGHKGNYSSYTPPGCTHTTKNPIKAALFAIQCPRYFTMPKVIFIAETWKLKNLNQLQGNHFYKEEEEINCEIQPLEFYKHCQGYIFLEEMKAGLKTIGKSVNEDWTFDNLTKQLKFQEEVKPEEIEKLMKVFKKLLKNA